VKHKQSITSKGSARQCAHVAKSGKRCNAFAIDGSAYCFAHDPASTAKRNAARLKGGFNRRTAARVSGDEAIKIATMADVLALVNAVLADTWQQDNCAARSRVLLACASVAIEALQVGEFEARLAALERGQGASRVT
jgi:hypothetical protein